MNSQLLYQDDSSILDFDAEVIERVTLPDGRAGVVLNQSYFYPTGGGQEFDTGLIGSARVVDVIKDEENSRLVHVVEGEVGLGPITAHIDAERRLRHMQHHTGQHLLTQSILRQTGFDTVSANINGYSPSTLDIVAPLISKPDLDQAELMANQVIYENRPVKTYFVTPAELQSIPLRRPPKVTENIRIVEIDGYDYSACGGTHVLRTGSIGLVKVFKAERTNEKMRIHFVAGLQALEMFREMYESITGLANKMTIGWQDLSQIIEKQSTQLEVLRKALQSLHQAAVQFEALEVVKNAEERNGIRFVRWPYDARPGSQMQWLSIKGKQISELLSTLGFVIQPAREFRMLAEEFRKEDDLVSFSSFYDGEKLAFIVTCGGKTGKDARYLLNINLSPMGGRGGGDEHIAQGGAVANEAQYQRVLADVQLD